MRCIFVLDILNGAVVHALRGERRSYRPITEFSRLVSTSEPLGLLGELCPQEVYVADLNLITGKGDNLKAIGEISGMAKTMADIGISRLQKIHTFLGKRHPVRIQIPIFSGQTTPS